MWDSRLAGLVRAYPTGILSWVQPSGDPLSVRVVVQLDAAGERVLFPALPPAAVGSSGLACLLFHAHDDHLEGLRQMVLKGELVNEDGALIFKAIEFVTANGRPGTDQMAHGGAPLHMFAFYRLGRRKAKEYLAKRAQPWPPIPFAEIGRKVLAEDDPPVEDA